ncbi:hypothetical protein VB711_08035 [Cronbergia sp. UHCC 0137]|uniref:hypothetical protein n=1 Tax=Cronbergia sp. UHCC 0137 TaxID=3110239 RepID=UPI002B1EB7FC|nr:hypothetical protein [Cronbergia sp. UHCC 0137]MEA5617786.1 hypothetical protein [Cronbergia sp. UHCC 0137]
MRQNYSRSQESGVRSQESGVRSQESGVKPCCEKSFINGLRQAALTIDVLTTLPVAIITQLIFLFPITHHPSPITHHPSPITHHPSPITHHPLPITHYPLPITHYLYRLGLAKPDH